MKNFVKVSLFAVILAFAPLLALGGLAIYLFVVAPVFFGVVFVSATLMYVLKSLVASAVITSVVCIWLAVRYLEKSKDCDKTQPSQSDTGTPAAA
jgi:membrane protein implicated in regulation of membrane protease activity